MGIAEDYLSYIFGPKFRDHPITSPNSFHLFTQSSVILELNPTRLSSQCFGPCHFSVYVLGSRPSGPPTLTVLLLPFTL